MEGAGPLMVVAGAGGRLGRLLAAAWAARPPAGGAPLLSSLRPRPEAGIAGWDILAGPPPATFAGAAALVALAGVTAGAGLDRNALLATAALARAAAAGIGHLFLFSSAAVYGPVAEGVATEDAALAPAGAYGAAKAAMEDAARAARRPGGPGLTLLRLANVVGADALGASLAAGGPVTIDDVGPPGAPAGPLRSWIGPATLARLLARLAGLAAAGLPLPEVLNVAAPRPLAMEALAVAAGRPVRFRQAPATAVARVVLDTARLQRIAPVAAAEATAAAMVAEAVATGAFPASRQTEGAP